MKKYRVSLALLTYLIAVFPGCLCTHFLRGPLYGAKDTFQVLLSVLAICAPYIVFALILCDWSRLPALVAGHNSNPRLAIVLGIMFFALTMFLFSHSLSYVAWANSPEFRSTIQSMESTQELIPSWLGGVTSGLAAFAFCYSFTFHPIPKHES